MWLANSNVADLEFDVQTADVPRSWFSEERSHLLLYPKVLCMIKFATIKCKAHHE